MTEKDLRDRISKLDYLTITKMSPEILAKLTNDFSKPLVRKLLVRGVTNIQQREIIKAVKSSYDKWMKKINPFWEAIPHDKSYPGFIEDFQLDIECDIMITDESEAEPAKDVEDISAKDARIKELEARIEELEKNQPVPISEEEIDAICDNDIDNKTLLEKGSFFVENGIEIKESDETEPLQARIKELEEENERLKTEIEELKEENGELKKQLAECSSTLLDIEEDEQKTDEKILYNKVSFECFLRLLEKAGFDLNNTGNKTRAGILWHMMTGKSSDELRRFCSSRAYKNNHTKADIKRLNEHLSDMDITCIKLP